MGRTIKPPATIETDFFVLVFDRFSEQYKLALPNGSSYLLGTAEESRVYLTRVLANVQLAEDAVDLAYNFVASQVIPAQNRTFPLDSGSFKSNAEDKEDNPLHIPQDFEGNPNWKPILHF